MIGFGSTGPRRFDQSGRAWLSAALLSAAAAMCSYAWADEAKMNDRAPTDNARSTPITLEQLIDEALKNTPEIAAGAREKEAAAHRVSPAGALDDPMFEAGLINVPIQPLRLNREDMTMKMLGISQRLPYPGKRGLREQVAAKDAESVALGYRETVNRVVREVKVVYYDLALT